MSSNHFPSSNQYICEVYAKGNFDTFLQKIGLDYHTFLQKIQEDICGPIQPLSEPFRYFMVFFDFSAQWAHVSLLSTREIKFLLGAKK